MKTFSKLRNVEYDVDDTIGIINHIQYTAYIKNGALPIDVYISKSNKTEEDILVMVFLISETKELYKRWKAHELN